MMQDDYHRPRQTDVTCWWCGRCAPGGVCPGPHTDYVHHSRRTRDYVEHARSPRQVVTVRGVSYPAWQ